MPEPLTRGGGTALCGGAAASALACETVFDQAAGCSPLRLHWPIAWRSLARRAHREVRASPGAGFCTMVTPAVTARRVSGVACGDSAAALAVGNDPTRILTSEQCKNHPVGSGNASFTFFTARVSPRKPPGATGNRDPARGREQVAGSAIRHLGYSR